MPNDPAQLGDELRARSVLAQAKQVLQGQAGKEAAARLTELLLHRGLYSPIELRFPDLVAFADLVDFVPERLNTRCSTCEGWPTTTWRGGGPNIEELLYECLSCEKETIKFFLSVKSLDGTHSLTRDRDQFEATKHISIEKVGQAPAWKAPIPRLLRKALGKDGVDHYVKGSASKREGLGIGAVSYFRRIVEDHVDQLLAIVEEAAVAVGDQETAKRVREANASFQATERLRIAAENTPLILRPDNHNPIGVLYDLLSDGLHNRSDEENAVIAARAQKALAFFFETWGAYKEHSKEFATDITKQATGTATRA